MVLFYDISFNLLGFQKESSLSYNKKENKEGGGKISLIDLPPLDSFYIIIYAQDETIGNVAVTIQDEIKALNVNNKGDETAEEIKDKNHYIASGYITDYSKNDNTINITFKTFDSLLKQFKTPKTWGLYNNLPLSEVVADIFFSFFTIYKSSKYELKGEVAKCLKNEGIAFDKITGGDLHLGFKENDTEKNNFLFTEKGYIIYGFDLGKPTTIKSCYNIDGKDLKEEDRYPIRTLRYSALIGSKTFINCYSIGRDTEFSAEDFKSEDQINNIRKEENKLAFKRSIKDYEKTTGALLSESAQQNRYVAIMFELIYKDPDYINDFVTQEVYQEDVNNAGKEIKVKRTVRGFTPIIQGFSILNRINIPPFSIKGIEEEKIETSINYSFNDESEKKLIVNNIKFDDISLFDALNRLSTDYHFNFAFDLKVKKDGSCLAFIISIYKNKHKNKNALYSKENKTVLQSKNSDVPLIANTRIKELQKQLKMCILLECKGKGEDIEARRASLFSLEEWTEKGRELNIYLYNPLGSANFSFNNKELKNIGIKESRTELPRNVFFVTERFEDTEERKGLTQKEEYKTFLIKAVAHFRKKIEENTFTSLAIETIEDGNIGDEVIFIYPEGRSVFNARITEQKTTIKNGAVKKSFAIGTGFFNPFDAFFEKESNYHFFNTPLTPININITSIKKSLFIEWLAVGNYDGFSIKIERIDGVKEAGFSVHKVKNNLETEREAILLFEHTTSDKIKIECLTIGVIYSVQVASYKDGDTSQYSYPIYIKLSNDLLTHRMLNSLEKVAEDDEEIGYYFEEDCREEERKKELEQKIKNHLTKKDINIDLNKFNNIEEVINAFNLNSSYNDETNLYDDETEEIERYYGFEYIWKGNSWVLRKEKPPLAPTFFLNYNPINLIPRYNLEQNKIYKEYLSLIDEWQKIRGRLNELERTYRLPEGSEPPKVWTYSLEKEDDKIMKEGKEIEEQNSGLPPIYNPPSNPIFPPYKPTPLPPNPNPDNPVTPFPIPSGDERKEPTEEIKTEYENKKKEYEDLKEKIDALHTKLIIKDYILEDATTNKCNLQFNLQSFEIVKKVCVNYKYSSPSIIITKPKKDIYLKYVNYAFNFYYSALDLGGYKHLKNGREEDKDNEAIPQFKIKNALKNEVNNDSILGGGANTYAYYTVTFSTYIQVNKIVGAVEVWNIGGFCIGLLEGDYLHFATKKCEKKKVIDEKTKKEKEEWKEDYHIFYSYKLKGDAPSSSGSTQAVFLSNLINKYNHIIVECSFKHMNRINNNTYMSTNEYSISQKIYINSREIRKEEYKNNNRRLTFSTEKEVSLNINEDVAFFNIKLKEEGTPRKYNPKQFIQFEDYKTSKYDVSLAETLLFNNSLKWGMRRYLSKNVNYPSEKNHTEKTNEKTTENPSSTENKTDGTFKGVCIEGFDENEKKILILGQEKELKEGDYFLMAKNYLNFKAGTLYKYITNKLPKNEEVNILEDKRMGNYLELSPYSAYKKEYAKAFNKTNTFLHLLDSSIFREFFTVSFSIITDLFSDAVKTEDLTAHNIQTDNLSINNNIILSNLPKEDPHIKDALYKRGRFLSISAG